jgi:chromosomal replication initiator protein
MSLTKNYWPMVLDILKSKISGSNYQAWFSSLEFISTAELGKKIILSTPSSFNKTYLEKKFKNQLKEIINKYYPKVLYIEFKIRNDKNKPNLPVQQEVFKEITLDGNPLNSQKNDNLNNLKLVPIQNNLSKNLHNLNPKYTFDNFVLTNNNQLAYNVANAIIKQPGELYNPVFIYSGVGLGKTHLLQAIGQKMLEVRPNFKIKYTTCETFFNLFLSSIKNKNNNQFKDYYRSADLLLIDDIQFISGKEATQEAFFHTFNELHQQNKQIVIASDKHPKSLSGVEDRLISRFEWGIVIDILKPELEDRINVLNDKLSRMQLNLNQDQITKIAHLVDTNFRDLEGVLNRIQATMKLLPEKPLEDFELNKLLSSYQYAAPMKINISYNTNSPDKIMQAVCQICNVSREEILDKSRQKNLVKARQILMYLYKESLDLSLPTIGKLLNRDHTTVLHSWRKITKELQVDSKLQTLLTQIQKLICSKIA